MPEKGVDTFTNSRYIELLDASDRWNQEEKALLKALIDRPATAESLIAATELNAVLRTAFFIAAANAWIIDGSSKLSEHRGRFAACARR